MSPAADPPAPGLAAARAAKARLLAAVGSHPAVNGIGLVACDGSYAVKVDLAHAPPPGLALPARMDGIEVRVEVVGPITRR